MTKIDSNISKQLDPTALNRSTETSRASQAGQSAVPASVGSASPASESDKIKVSERGSEIARLKARAGELPDVRQEKVAALRERVQSGDYNPKASEIANAILKDEKK